MGQKLWISRACQDEVCGICPSLRHPLGAFDVYERPSAEARFNPADGHRYDAAGTPVCVHPLRCGLAPGRYASRGEPLPDVPGATTTPPADEDDDAADAAPAAITVVEAPPRPAPVRPAAALRPPVARRDSSGPRSSRKPRPEPLAQSDGGTAGVVAPDDAAALASWFAAQVTSAAPEAMAEVLDAAERAAHEHHPADVVLDAMRRALSGAL